MTTSLLDRFTVRPFALLSVRTLALLAVGLLLSASPQGGLPGVAGLSADFVCGLSAAAVIVN